MKRDSLYGLRDPSFLHLPLAMVTTDLSFFETFLCLLLRTFDHPIAIEATPRETVFLSSPLSVPGGVKE